MPSFRRFQMYGSMAFSQFFEPMWQLAANIICRSFSVGSRILGTPEDIFRQIYEILERMNDASWEKRETLRTAKKEAGPGLQVDIKRFLIKRSFHSYWF